MNILSSIGGNSSNSATLKPEKLTQLSSKNVDCQKQPLFVRPICNEEKIRSILNLQDTRDKLYKQQRSQHKLWKAHQQKWQTPEQLQSTEATTTTTPPQSADQQPQQQQVAPKPKLNCYWREFVKLEGFPVNTVRAYWAQQHRCIIVTAKIAQLDKDFKKKRHQNEHFTQENVSPLTQQARWAEEKNLHRMKRIIPVPNYVCAKDLEVFMDTERGVIIVCARRSSKWLKCPGNEKEVQDQWVDKECLLVGNEQQLHQRCQPTKALLTSFLNLSSRQQQQQQGEGSHDDWERLCKSIITEDSDLQGISHLLRQQLKELKRTTFPGLMQSPRFVKDPKTGHWSVLLQLRLRSAAFRPENVHVRGDEARHIVLVEAKSDVRELLTRHVVEIRSEIPLPELVDVSKLKYNFLPQEGVLRMEMPLNRDKIQEMQQRTQPSKK